MNKVKKLNKILLIFLLTIMLSHESIAALQGIGSLSFNFSSGTTTGFSSYINNWREAVGLERHKEAASTGKNNELRVVGVGYKQTASEHTILNAQQFVSLQEESAGRIIEGPLVYPNPFQMSENGGIIYYELSKNMEIEIQIFDMNANKVYQRSFAGGALGGFAGINKVHIQAADFNNRLLSAGVYFYLILNKDDVMAKGKMAIIP